MYKTIELRMDTPVAVVALNRPEVRNAFDALMISELTDCFAGLAGQDGVRAVVLRGNGRAFSAGADVNWMRSSLDFTPDENVADARRMSEMFAAIDGIPKPVVGLAHGAALGGGMGLLAVCDVVIAVEGTTFGFTEVKLGIIPAVISRFVLPKIGESWARSLFVTGERFGSDVARQIGLVHWIAAEDEVDPLLEGKISEILTSGPRAAGAAKSLIHGYADRRRDELRDWTADQIAELRAGKEGQEGLRSFLEKRRPNWIES
jgi:methylglutaconyl-CoA hydratase